MTTFVLVHGAFHGAWCWFKLVAELEKRGQRAVAIDLPGAGDDPTPVASVTLADCARRVVAAVSAEAEPVVLVAHSLGGLPATLAAEAVPRRLRRLVCLSAFMMKTGDCFLDARSYAGYPEDPGPPHFVRSDDGRTVVAVPEIARARWYNDCSEADIAYALARCTPVPTEELSAPVRFTAAGFGSVPKSYVHATLDHAAVPALQHTMAAAAGCHPNFTLPTGHSSFFSTPELLAETLVKAAELPDG